MGIVQKIDIPNILGTPGRETKSIPLFEYNYPNLTIKEIRR